MIMVLAKDQDRRDLVAGILNAHGAEFMGFYGRWAWSSMSGTDVGHTESPRIKSENGRSYETQIDGLTFRLNFDFQDEIVDATITQPDGTVRHTKGALRRLR